MKVKASELGRGLMEPVRRNAWGPVRNIDEWLVAIAVKGKWIEVRTDEGIRYLFAWDIYNTLNMLYTKNILGDIHDMYDFVAKLSCEKDLEFVFSRY